MPQCISWGKFIMFKFVPAAALHGLIQAINADGAPVAKLDEIRTALAAVIRKMMDPHECRFEVKAVDGAALECILPESLAKDWTLARQVVDNAIVEANRTTSQGADGDYFDCLSALLEQAGIQALKSPASLGNARAWDSDCLDVLGDMLTHGGGTEVTITNAPDVFEHRDADVLDAFICASGEEVSINAEHAKQIRVMRIEVAYPRSDRYGVPETASDRGAREYVRGMGFLVPPEVDVFPTDTRDSTPMSFKITALVKDDLLIREVPGQDAPNDIGPAS